MNFEPLLKDQLVPWVNKATSIIRARVEDASSHAVRAVSRKLLDTEDGRQTYKAVKKSRQYLAAISRLYELQAALAGPSEVSLDGLIRDAREEFLRNAYTAWGPALSGPYFKLAAQPSAEAIRAARGAPVHGMELRHELDGSFDVSIRALRQAIAAASLAGATPEMSQKTIDAWEQSTAMRITNAVITALSDSQTSIFYSVPYASQVEKD